MKLQQILILLLLSCLGNGVLYAETLDISVSQSSDDAEEKGNTVYLGSSDLELVNDGGDIQVLGIRFQNMTIPKSATIANAYIQFTSDETDSEATTFKKSSPRDSQSRGLEQW